MSIDKDIPFQKFIHCPERSETVWSQEQQPGYGGKSGYEIMLERGHKKVILK
jgi:hypothetical protein